MTTFKSNFDIFAIGVAMSPDLSNLADWATRARQARSNSVLPSQDAAEAALARHIAKTEGLAALPANLLPEYAYIRRLMAETPQARQKARVWGLRSFSQALAFEAQEAQGKAWEEAAQTEAVQEAQDAAAEAANAA